MPRVATLTFNGRRRSRSSRSLLPGVRATFCEVCRSNGDVRGRRLDCDAPAHLEAGYLSPRGGVNPPRRGLFFMRGRIGGSRLVKNTAIDPLWANSMARVSNHRALRLAKLESRSADYLRRSQLRARRQVAASHTRRRTSPARENTHAARPSRRIREDSGRTLGRDNRERRGFGTGEKTVWASSETTPVTPWWIARPRSRP